MKDQQTIGSALSAAAEALKDHGVPDPVRQARDLLGFAAGKDPVYIIAHPETPLSETEMSAFEAVVMRRCAREPFQHITGKQEFYGLEFKVSGDVMIPRPETELIVSAGIELLKGKKEPLICEVGVGSGCILVSLLNGIPDSRGVGLDISGKALQMASENAAAAGVNHRLELLRSDVFEALGERQGFDLIASNPPYVPAEDVASLQPEVRDYEPIVSLTDGSSGLSIIRRIIGEAPNRLRGGGHLLLEIGFNQSGKVLEMFETGMWSEVKAFPDLQGIPRMIRASLSATYEGCATDSQG